MKESWPARSTPPDSAAPAWDYTEHAKFYHARPNYCEASIDWLCTTLGAPGRRIVAADVGAGTGNLSLLLAPRGITCIPIEPNEAMRKIGESRTDTLANVMAWRAGTAAATTLDDRSVDLYAMGSSFNTSEPAETFRETRRVLDTGGHFTCMWNHRLIDEDPLQTKVERLIRELVPAYSPGRRREDQTAVLESSGLFASVQHRAFPFSVSRDIEAYLDAWRSVRNTYWDLSAPEGRAVFGTICARIRETLPARFDVPYITRIWLARLEP